MGNSRVKSQAEYDMIRSNQEKNNKSNPFKATNNTTNDYFAAITRRNKDEYYRGSPEPSNNQLPPTSHMSSNNNYVANDVPMDPVTNIKQSIASNQSTGNAIDHVNTMNPFATVSPQPTPDNTANYNPQPNAQPNYNNYNVNPNAVNPNNGPANTMPPVNATPPPVDPNYNNYNNNYNNGQTQNYVNQDYANQNYINQNYANQNYVNQDPNAYNNQGPNNNQLKAMYEELKQKNMQQNVNPEPMEMGAPNPMTEPDYHFIANNNISSPRATVNAHYDSPKMPDSHEALTIAQQANKINELINGINQGSIEPELRYADNFDLTKMPPAMGPGPNSNDKAIMDDIDKELEAMLTESDLGIEVDKDDFTSENENLIEQIKRAESGAQAIIQNNTPVPVGISTSGEDIDEIQKTLNEITQTSNEIVPATKAVEPPKPVEPPVPVSKKAIEANTQPENAIDQMISELDKDSVSDKMNNNEKLNLSDTLSLALDKNEVMQISKEKMLEEDLEEDGNKKKSKLDILINGVLLIMIIVVLGLVAKMILG